MEGFRSCVLLCILYKMLMERCYAIVAGAKGELQLWSILPTGQRQGWKVPGRGEAPRRLPLQRTCWIS